MNADWVILEPVDENFNPVGPGRNSHTVLLTNLINRVQPIIRYNLGDRITMRPDACPCGNPLPAIRVEGRTDEVLRLSASNGRIVPVLPLAIWAVIKGTSGVMRFQIIQVGPATLKVRLETMPESTSTQDTARLATWDRVKANMLDYLNSQGLANVEVCLANEQPERDPRSGKFRHVWVEYKREIA